MAIQLPEKEKFQLIRILQQITFKCDLDALALVTKTGFKIEFFSRIDIDVNIFSSLAATMDGTGSLVSTKMNTGILKEIIIAGETGYTILYPIRSFVLIGASHEFYSLGKTRLILQEYGEQLPKLKFLDENSDSIRACEHYCELEKIACCNCSNREKKCNSCLNRV